MAISLEICLVFFAVVVSVMTTLLPIWAWAAGAAGFGVLIPLGLYHQECIALIKRPNTRVDSHVSPPLSVQLTSNGSVGKIDNGLERFRACLPHTSAMSETNSAISYTGTLGTFNIGLQVFHSGSAEFGQIATELEYLTKQLSALGIQSPDIWGEEGNDSFDKVHFRLRAWSSHLAWLEAKLHQEDLKGARFQQE